MLNKVLIIIIAFLVVLLMLPKCESPVKPSNELQSKVDSLTLLIEKAKPRIDTIDVERIKVVTRYKTFRDTLNIHDTVAVVRFVALTDSVIRIDSALIVELKAVNNTYSSLVILKDTQLSDAKIELHLTKKRNRKRIFVGVLSGVGIGLVGGLLLK